MESLPKGQWANFSSAPHESRQREKFSTDNKARKMRENQMAEGELML